MKVVIIEDERPAAEKLAADLKKISNPPELLAVLNSVEAAIKWFKEQPQPDLVFMDIELTDGLSFIIPEKAKLSCPIIFVTAYDEYWQKALELNSVDYILKPVKLEKLEAAIKKYDFLKQHFSASYQQLLEWHRRGGSNYKKRLLVKQGVNYHAVKTEDIAYYYAVNKLVCLVDKEGKKLLLDNSLSDIEVELNPILFFRLNRKYIVNIDAISKISAYGKGKLQIQLKPATKEEIIVSAENVLPFKTWMTR